MQTPCVFISLGLVVHFNSFITEVLPDTQENFYYEDNTSALHVFQLTPIYPTALKKIIRKKKKERESDIAFLQDHQLVRIRVLPRVDGEGCSAAE